MKKSAGEPIELEQGDEKRPKCKFRPQIKRRKKRR
jgi:hypothetical protein